MVQIGLSVMFILAAAAIAPVVALPLPAFLDHVGLQEHEPPSHNPTPPGHKDDSRESKME